jgi:hypothetical protein
MADTLMTELEAVNIILGSIGEAPINTLSGTLPVDVNTAVDVLKEVRRKVCEQGWFFNSEYEIQSTLDGSGNVVLASNVLKCEPTYPSYDLQLVQRGNKLYDLRNHTYVFTQAPKLDIVYFLSWDELPQAAREYIAYRAARTFQGRVMGSPELEQTVTREEMIALRDLKAWDAQVSNTNIFDSYDMARLHLYRRR